MTEYWVSTPKFFCTYCKIYITDNTPSRKNHEKGVKHKNNVEEFMKKKRIQKQEKDRETNDTNKEIAALKALANKQYLKDLESGHGDRVQISTTTAGGSSFFAASSAAASSTSRSSAQYAGKGISYGAPRERHYQEYRRRYAEEEEEKMKKEQEEKEREEEEGDNTVKEEKEGENGEENQKGEEEEEEEEEERDQTTGCGLWQSVSSHESAWRSQTPPPSPPPRSLDPDDDGYEGDELPQEEAEFSNERWVGNETKSIPLSASILPGSEFDDPEGSSTAADSTAPVFKKRKTPSGASAKNRKNFRRKKTD